MTSDDPRSTPPRRVPIDWVGAGAIVAGLILIGVGIILLASHPTTAVVLLVVGAVILIAGVAVFIVKLGPGRRSREHN